jgi:DNA-binding NarL/FixJ family response regulator
VAEGLLILPDSALERLAEIAAERAEEEDGTGPSSAALTPREKEVLQLLAAGASNKVIARQLDATCRCTR